MAQTPRETGGPLEGCHLLLQSKLMDSHTPPDNVTIGYSHGEGRWYCCQKNRFNTGWYPDGYLYQDGTWKNRCGDGGYFRTQADIKRLLKKLYNGLNITLTIQRRRK